MFWETKKSEKENEELDRNLTELVDNLAHRSALLRFLAVCAAGNALVWLAVLATPSAVYQGFGLVYGLSDKVGMSLLGLPFGFAMFAAYCLLRLKFPDVEDNKQLDSAMMASFEYQAQSGKRWFIWMGSILAGVVNVLLLILADLYLTGAF